MKMLSAILCLALVVGLTAAALAQCPVSGWYRTSDGTLHPGRVSEAWCGADGAPQQPGQPGNTENAMSDGGGPLGDMWKVWGQMIDETGAVETGRNLDEFGTGWVDYNTNYVGGEFWLSPDYPWGAESTVPIVGMVTYYNVSARVNYIEGQLDSIDSNLYMQGVFDECLDDLGDPRCFVELTIANAALVWSSEFGTPAPGGYPEFLCDADLGELFYACCITTVISCDGVATDSESWGAIKSLYR